ncbi:intermediate filament family protein [Pectobacterium parvum]|uniref:hypothetical protein n=1 Tax=Pectobacterium parvum TaxID=2778550 RepID=UPI0037F34674
MSENINNHENNYFFRERVKRLINAGLLSKIRELKLLNLYRNGDIDAAEKMLFDYELSLLHKEKESQQRIDELNNKLQKSINKCSFLEKKSEEFYVESQSLEEKNINLSEKVTKISELYESILSNNKSLKEKIDTLEKENNELKEKNQQSRIDENISDYVESVKNKLNSDDSFFIRMSHIWSGCGSLFCVCAIVAAFLTFKTGVDTLLRNEDLNSISLFYLFTRGLLGIALLSWLSYICFNNSRRYTHESIRRKDRQHALMFGQIFLQIFGGTASKEDAIHVFKDWNMSGDTAFSGKIEQPPSVHGLLAQIKNMLPEKSGKASDSTKKEDDN